MTTKNSKMEDFQISKNKQINKTTKQKQPKKKKQKKMMNTIMKDLMIIIKIFKKINN